MDKNSWPLWDDFFQSLQHQGLSQHTQLAYQRDLIQLKQNLPPDIIPANTTRLHIISVLKQLSFHHCHPRSLARKLSAWRSYYQFLRTHQYLNHDPCLHIKAPKAPSRLPKALPAEQLNQLLDQPIKKNELSLRDQAIFELMYGSGLRLSEVTSLNLDHLLLDEGWVHVSGKGQKQRQVPLSQQSIQAIRQYLNYRTSTAEETAVFTNRFGRRLGARQIQNRLNQWSIQHQSDRHLSPHMLRHSYASHLLQNAHNIRAVQELLGHSSLSTTQQYTKLDFDHLATAYDDAHPRAKRK